MVEAVSYSKPSAVNGILATSAVAAVLNAGIQAGCELYNVKTAPKKFQQLSDAYIQEAKKLKGKNLKVERSLLLKTAEYYKGMKNYKFNWKNVGRGALFGAVATAVLCTVFHGVGALFNKQ